MMMMMNFKIWLGLRSLETTSDTTLGGLFGRVQKAVLIQETPRPHNGWPIFWVALQTLTNHIDRRIINFVRDFNCVIRIDNCLQLLNKVEICKGCPSMDHFV